MADCVVSSTGEISVQPAVKGIREERMKIRMRKLIEV